MTGRGETRTYIVNRARKLFKEYKTSADVARIKAKLRDARKVSNLKTGKEERQIP